MSSENLSSAGNQQERLSSEERRSWFLAGFVEGEGSVTVGIKKHPTQRLGYYFQPEFFIYQHRVRRDLLEMAQEFFGTGRIKPKPGNPDVLVFSIISRASITARVLPFLRDYMRYSARRADYEKFALVVDLMNEGRHREPEGLAAIAKLSYSMNMNGKQRRIDLQEILDRILRGHTPDTLKPE
jgi:LAGLIDADG DNA endonuclease family protein